MLAELRVFRCTDSTGLWGSLTATLFQKGRLASCLPPAPTNTTITSTLLSMRSTESPPRLSSASVRCPAVSRHFTIVTWSCLCCFCKRCANLIPKYFADRKIRMRMLGVGRTTHSRPQRQSCSGVSPSQSPSGEQAACAPIEALGPTRGMCTWKIRFLPKQEECFDRLH